MSAIPISVSPLAMAWEAVPGIVFSVKPRLCVLRNGEDLCRDELEVRWKSEIERSICLYRKDKSLPLRCWEGETSGSHSFALSAANNVDFELREMENERLLVSKAFEVIHDEQQYRRRRRNPWSFF